MDHPPILLWWSHLTLQEQHGPATMTSHVFLVIEIAESALTMTRKQEAAILPFQTAGGESCLTNEGCAAQAAMG